MKKSLLFFKMCQKVTLLTAVGLLSIGQVTAGEENMDELFAYYSSLNTKSTLTLGVGQQNPLELKLSVAVSNASLADFVTALQKSAGDKAFFNIALGEAMKNIDGITINAKSLTLKEILDSVLPSKNLTYSFKGNVFIITKKQTPQNNTLSVNGMVVDATTKKPVSGATVLVVGTTNGAITDDRGQFFLSAKVGSQIEVSCVGMKPIVRSLTAADAAIVLEMDIDAMAVEDVVVTGIFNKSKESYTGSVVSITAKEMKAFRGQSVLSTLKNMDPSLNIATSNQFGSDPNRLPDVTIRGNSSLPTSVKELNEGAKKQLNAPLVIMDGFEVPLQKLIDLNDEEIETINILKDASATSIYGSRGANGVIVIVTKAPVAGKLKVFLQAGINIEMPDLSSYDLMGATEKLTIERAVGFYDDEVSPTSDRGLKEMYNRLLAETLRGVDTYWIGQPVRTGIGQKYNLKLEGGNEEFRWSALVGYNNVLGAMKDSKRDNFNGTINLAYTFKNIIFKNQTQVNINKGVNSKYGKFSEYAKMNPYWRIHDEKGDLIKTYKAPGGGTEMSNPLYDASLNSIDQDGYTQIVNNFSLEWNIVDALKFRAQLGLTKTFNTSDKYLPHNHTEFDKVSIAESFRKGTYSYGTGEDFSYDASLNLSYSKVFNDVHQVYAGFDYNMSQNKGFMYYLNTEGFPGEDMSFVTNALRYSTLSPVGEESASRRVGFTGNFNYTYDNRYFADFTYRTDGSSQFGSKNKFAPFWSAGLGWNIHREKFMVDNKVINNLRLRGSIGDTGSQQFEAYKALSTFKYYTDRNYLIWNAAELMGLGNENLKWQTTRQLNAGIELGMFNNRISASFDIYNKTTSNLLSMMAMPLSNGFDSFTDNVGKVKNNGFEAMLSGYLVRNTSKEIFWTVTGKLAYNKDVITKLSDAIKLQNEEYLIGNNQDATLVYEGYSQKSIYAVRTLGIDPSTGDEVYLDRNGNITDTWKSIDRVYLGVEQPKYRGNISTMFTYKNFSVNMSFGYHWGGKQYNETLIDKVEVPIAAIKSNLDRRVLTDRWLKPGDVKFFKAISSTETKKSSRFVMDDNVFEMQNISVQYRLNSKKLTEKTNLQSINFALDMSDVFYISSVKRERGTDYPFARRVGLTISLLF